MNYIKLNGNQIEVNKIKEFVDENDLNHIEVQLQSKPISEVGENGCQIDDVIFLCKEILKSFNDKVPSRQTSIAITKIEEAVMWLENRTKERQKRNVEGTNQE
jgi:hypothetical protein